VDRSELEGGMSPSSAPSRREAFLAAAVGVAVTSGCGREARHPERLRYLLRRDINSVDPVRSPEVWVMSALFEPLVQPHPETTEPIAGLATHCLIENGGTRYTFFLRGHASPRGTRLASSGALPFEFTRGRPAERFDVPARWSDGTEITAEDCVHYWRRYLDPRSANADAYMFNCIAGAETVAAGKMPPEQLGVRAIDRFAVQVDLVDSTPYFLLLCCIAFITPRRVIEQARREGCENSWTEPGRIATSGPFRLKELRPHDRTVVTRNPLYFDAAFVGVEEIEFSAADGVTVVNLFRSGLADSMEGRVLPLQLAPRLKGEASLHVRPASASHSWRFSANRQPMDRLTLRCALNMATDKQAITRFLGMGQSPAKTRVPPLPHYPSVSNLRVDIDGRPCEILAYDPRTARELWRATPNAPARLAIHYPARIDSRLLAEIQQHQWKQNLAIETDLQAHEPAAYIDSIFTQGDFTGVAEDTAISNFADPYDSLSLYAGTYPSWSDAAFGATLNAASAITNPALRMKELAECEATLMRAMPMIPLYYDTWVYLERPEVHGLRLNPLGVPAFKYAWIESKRSIQ
jgi:ABC-type oligopeptide transport system substrate-binding subunit